METLLNAAIIVAAIALAGILVGLLVNSRRLRVQLAVQRAALDSQDKVLDDFIDRILAVFPDAALLVDATNGTVQKASNQAIGLGLVNGDRIAVVELEQMISAVRRIGGIREGELSVRRSPLARGKVELGVRVAPLNDQQALVLVEDLSAARRVDAVRRDFVANVSHELKTPVGALSLLSEAVLAASDDPSSVRHFAGRMQSETTRLAHLVSDLIDLSRLQGDDPLQSAVVVKIDDVVTEAVDDMRMAGQNHEIEIVYGGTEGLGVFGVESQLVTAVRNLLANAIAYSPQRTRVAVATRLEGGIVEISVADQGIGIPESELGRIFERFYRVDQARSRATGGTGLGLAIVKHVCHNHGGSVDVWSKEGMGTTFTLRLPSAQQVTSGASGSAGLTADRPLDAAKPINVTDSADIAAITA